MFKYIGFIVIFVSFISLPGAVFADVHGEKERSAGAIEARLDEMLMSDALISREMGAEVLSAGKSAESSASGTGIPISSIKKLEFESIERLKYESDLSSVAVAVAVDPEKAHEMVGLELEIMDSVLADHPDTYREMPQFCLRAGGHNGSRDQRSLASAGAASAGTGGIQQLLRGVEGRGPVRENAFLIKIVNNFVYISGDKRNDYFSIKNGYGWWSTAHKKYSAIAPAVSNFRSIRSFFTVRLVRPYPDRIVLLTSAFSLHRSAFFEPSHFIYGPPYSFFRHSHAVTRQHVCSLQCLMASPFDCVLPATAPVLSVFVSGVSGSESESEIFFNHQIKSRDRA